MIALQLADHRVLTFEPAQGRQPPVGVTPGSLNVVGVEVDGVRGLPGPADGPDFVLQGATGETSVVELKIVPATRLAKTDVRKWRDALIRRFRRFAEKRAMNQPSLQFWVLSQDGNKLRVWKLDGEGNTTEEASYYLSDVSSATSESTDAVLTGDPRVTTGSLILRIDEWSSRIDQLYHQIATWALEFNPTYDIDTTARVQMNEELMQRYAIAARDLPVLVIREGGREVIRFKPYGLWVIGANGRVDVFTPSESLFLVDRAENFQGPRWQLYGANSRRLRGWRLVDGVDLTDEVLRALLNG